MNETLQVLKNRRSCRNFKPTQIKDEALNAILEAGTYAPTGMGMQSPIMVVVQDKETIDYMSKINGKIMGFDGDPFYGAPTVVIVFADTSRYTYIEDGSLVMGNLMNAAHAIGVDSCWIHRAKELFEMPEGKALMKKWGISENYAGIGNCVLGYAATPIPPAKARKEDYIRRV